MKIYVGNLPFSIEEEGLRQLFASYGEITEATIIKDKFSGRSKGFGFVTIADDESAKKAVSEMNGKDCEGRELKVSEAKPMEERAPGERPRRSFNGGGRSSFGGRSGGFGGRSREGGRDRRF